MGDGLAAITQAWSPSSTYQQLLTVWWGWGFFSRVSFLLGKGHHGYLSCWGKGPEGILTWEHWRGGKRPRGCVGAPMKMPIKIFWWTPTLYELLCVCPNFFVPVSHCTSVRVSQCPDALALRCFKLSINIGAPILPHPILPTLLLPHP